ncbi:UDP-rhamnose/UDP-galactose transporter 1 [Cocos nucifera]|uniref:UDP-rhamnose/UDP-galactose transporter 1 n=1 Tax=Cocos nucifera TaxID=13894 RepID=A0A8K0IPQ1_COCNU|nr:UDP-rhamnose/UDP-galactose transporter 1 [Cocos nucifera]
MEEGKKSAVSDAGAWAMNVVSSVGIIMANKQLMSPAGYAFSFATTLTGFHFAVTAFVGFVSNATGFSSSKHVPLWELLWFSIVANTSITGMNLSLMLNSVGFYQISKLSMIPVVCVMEWILHSKHYSKEVKMAVVVVVVGVGVCTVTDSIGSLQKKYSIGSFELLSKTAPIQALSLLFLGPFIDYYLNGKSLIKYNFSSGVIFFILLSCALAVFCNMSQYLCIGRFSATSFQSIGSLQKKYSIGSFELLSKTAPIQALSLLFLGPFIDYYLNGKSLIKYNFSSGVIFFILLSCALAVFCNMSQYLCIGRFSATSFQVLGHMKTVCVLMLGWLLFDSQLTLKNIMGMVIAIVGMVVYSWAVELEKQASAKIALTKTSLTEDEIRLLKDEVENAPIKDVELGETKA